MSIVNELHDAAWEAWWKINNHTDQLYDLKQSEATILVGNVLYQQLWNVLERGASSTKETTSGVINYGIYSPNYPIIIQHIVTTPHCLDPRCTDIYTLSKKWGMLNNSY